MATLERETELDGITAALDDAADGGGRTLLIEGPAGIGKTRLISHAHTLARSRGFERVTAVGEELEKAISWAVVRQLLERLIARGLSQPGTPPAAGPAAAGLAALELAARELAPRFATRPARSSRSIPKRRPSTPCCVRSPTATSRRRCA